MTDLSLHGDTDDNIDVEPDRRATSGTSRWQKVVGIIGLVVVLWVGNEMYDVIFYNGTFRGVDHRPGGTPVQNQNQEPDTDDGGGHDPSQFDH